MLSRAPDAALRPFVALLWASDGADEARPGSGRELVIPTGAVHVAIRLGGRPLRIFDHASDGVGRTIGCAVVGGARERPYLRDVSLPGPGVGALLRPGAAGAVLGAPAGALSHAHVLLEDLWGAGPVATLCERLNEAGTAARRLALLEGALAARLPAAAGADGRIAQALRVFDASGPVRAAAQKAGLSHRHFTGLFHETVGLRPKAYGRLLRFGRALDRLAAEPGIGWAALAAECGYADQPHFTREFTAFAGLSPGRYRRAAPRAARHVPL